MTHRIALTFGDAGENHVGMEMVGKLGEIGSGFTVDELRLAETNLRDIGMDADYHSFDFNGESAGVLIIRNFLDTTEHNSLLLEMDSFEWDTKYWDRRRKKVLNKRARSNVVILDGITQEPDYENGKGRIVDGNSLETFREVKKSIRDHVEFATKTDKSQNLICEGNRYNELKNCGIGYHGDAERRKVIALSLGASSIMRWQWFHNSKPVGNTYEFTFNGGDIYIMSEKAVGYDWKSRSKLTMRHAAGAKKYISLDRFRK